jgi:hypothetical protein
MFERQFYQSFNESRLNLNPLLNVCNDYSMFILKFRETSNRYFNATDFLTDVASKELLYRVDKWLSLYKEVNFLEVSIEITVEVSLL